MKIGILGGTFNPPHLGHLILAQEACQKVGLDRVFFVPTNIPPHKQSGNVSAQDRLKMVKLLVDGDKRFVVTDVEIKRSGVSYTIDTVRELRKKYPDDELYLIVGSDLANNFSSWRYFDELKKEIEIVVARRRDYPLRREGDFWTVGILQMGISSSYIRSLIKRHFGVKYLVTDKVARYIEKHKLYK
jgi:nicotinate-nucleotide adenylyltransferase